MDHDVDPCYGAMSHADTWWLCQHNVRRTDCHHCFADHELDLIVWGRQLMEQYRKCDHGVAHYNTSSGNKRKPDDDDHPNNRRPPLHPVLRKSISGIFSSDDSDADPATDFSATDILRKPD